MQSTSCETVSYKVILGGLASQELLSECSALYSQHYGKWAANAPTHQGGLVKLSAQRLRDWLKSKDANIYQARVGDTLIGYAIAVTLRVPDFGVVSWVTQLVVHTDYRKKDVAKTLLFSIWGLSDHSAWGIVSANPYAVRALEKATRRRCNPSRIARNSRRLVNVGVINVPYISKGIAVRIDKGQSSINTQFFIDHSEIEAMVREVTSLDVPWLIGSIDDGWEWFAFTFRNQKPINLTAEEIEKMIAASDQVTKQAYSRMRPSPKQTWMTHVDAEVELIAMYCKLRPGDTVIDFGCGTGRHSIELAKSGMSVIGVDYVEESIKIAREKAADIPNATFVVGDGRSIHLSSDADAVICLYDVVGSYADNDENQRILGNITRQLRNDGFALISVMNYEVTEANAKYKFEFSREPNRLLELPASRIMEQSGNVFNPEYYIVDVQTHVVYRREQFLDGDSLPVELLVRDRRFSKGEIETMCEAAGLEVLWSRFVSAGRWEHALDSRDVKAKEILLLCRKSGRT